MNILKRVILLEMPYVLLSASPQQHNHQIAALKDESTHHTYREILYLLLIKMKTKQEIEKKR